MDKGTILYIGGFELPDKNAAAQRVISNGKAFKDLGYTVIFDGVSNNDIDVIDMKKPKNFFGFEVYSQRYPTNFIKWIMYVTQLRRYISLIEKYDDVRVIICYNLPSGSLLRLWFYCKRHRIQLLADCTEWYLVPKSGNLIRRYTKKIDIDLRMKVLHAKLDGVISISSYLHNYYLGRKVQSCKIPPLVDIKDEKWRCVSENANDVIQVTYAGSPFSFVDKTNVKDRLDLIIHAFAALKKDKYEFALHIVGITINEILTFFPGLKSEVQFLEGNIKFYGKIEHQSALNVLKRSDYSIFLRDTNQATLAGFPTKFVESISCGTPVLTNVNSNLGDYLKDGINGFWINMADRESVKKSLEAALSISRVEIDAMRKHCLNSALFDYRNYQDEFKFLLQ